MLTNYYRGRGSQEGTTFEGETKRSRVRHTAVVISKWTPVF